MKGTKEAPIVMTSEEAPGNRKPGDWGGLIICGKAKNNEGTKQIEGGPRTTFGGDNDSDNSGIYQYIRVEFAGYPFKTDQETTESLLVLSVAVQPSTTYKYLIPTMILTNGSAVR